MSPGHPLAQDGLHFLIAPRLFLHWMHPSSKCSLVLCPRLSGGGGGCPTGFEPPESEVVAPGPPLKYIYKHNIYICLYIFYVLVYKSFYVYSFRRKYTLFSQPCALVRCLIPKPYRKSGVTRPSSRMDFIPSSRIISGVFGKRKIGRCDKGRSGYLARFAVTILSAIFQTHSHHCRPKRMMRNGTNGLSRRYFHHSSYNQVLEF